MEQTFELIAKTFMGLEPVLAKELTQMGAENVQIGRRMVTFTGNKELMYRANFSLHTAIKILKPISRFKAQSADDVYEEIKKIDWSQYLDNDHTFAVDAVVFSEEFRHSKFVSYKVKDAIVDQFREKTGNRPNISVANPDLRLHIHIADVTTGQSECTLCLDSSGESLHRRGYRQESVEAPLNEVLAAGMILMTGWRGETDFIDPMCGSGTLLVEAALIARNMAPGLFRKEYAFEKWPDFDAELFDRIYNDDSQEREFTHHIYGYDIDMKAVNTARMNVKAAGLTADITVEQQDFKDFTQPKEKSILVSNPPYGERITTPDLLGTYRMIGERLKHQFQGGDAWILSYREECFDQIGLKPSIKIPLFNGSLECEFRKYTMFDGKLKEFRSEGGVVKTEEEKRQMGEKHRFKKEREFKRRLDEQEENEEADIRSFTFHKHELKEERPNRARYAEESEKSGKFGRSGKSGHSGKSNYSGKNRKYGNDNFEDKHERRFGDKHEGRFEGKNRGGHERFDRSGGKKPYKKTTTDSIMTKTSICIGAFTALCFFCSLIPAKMAAQEKKLFTLEDLNYGGYNYHNLRPQNLFLTWWGEQLMYQDAEEGGTIDAKGKKCSVFSIKDLGSDWHSAMYASYPYPDEPLVLLRNGKERILYNFKKKVIVWKQTANHQEAEQHWSKESRALAFKRDYQLFVRDTDGQEHQLTTDGSREIVYGEAVHRNEWGINEGLFWSPDGQRLAFYRMDQSMVTDYPQVNIDTRIAEMEPDKYPMAGMESHKVSVGIYDLQTGKTIYLSTRTEPSYFTNIAWSPDSKTIYMQELTRDQRKCCLVAYDAENGNLLKELYQESSDKYVEPLHPILFLPWDNSKFIMQSQKDGYNHLYLFDTDGHELKQLTKGKWVVMDVGGFNKKTQSIIILSNEKNPLQRNLYAVSVKTGKRTPLDKGIGCTQQALLSASGQLFFHKYSTPDISRVIEVGNTTNGKCSELLRADDPWHAYQQPLFESGSIKAADGITDLYYRMVKPTDFDPTKKYPTIIYVYGGPHAHNVEASWHWQSRSWETYMAQKGYILFILDNRGSENRGLAFEQATFHQLGQVEMQDQMKGVDFLRSLPYVDMSRLGVHGWSFGGFMTISLMLNYPDVFKVGVAGGPVIDWKWYEVMYGERYMGTPEQNPEGYEKTSLINKADRLKGKLQIIIGNNDPTVVPQHALSFLKACIETGTQPDFFVYPGEGHNMAGHSSVHLHERITQYFEDYLK